MASPEWFGERWRGTGTPTISPAPLPLSHGARKGVGNCWRFYYHYFSHETLGLGSPAGDQLYHRLAVVSGGEAPCPCPPIAYWDNPRRSASPRRHHCALRPRVLAEQKEDLERQVQRLQAFAQEQGWTEVTVVTDIGSGLNGKRKNLLRILRIPRWFGLSWSIAIGWPGSDVTCWKRLWPLRDDTLWS
jgi:hypothetical protein